MTTFKIVVFTGDLSYTVRAGIVEIDRSISNLAWLVVVHTQGKSVQGLFHSQVRNIRRNGWRWFPYQFKDAFARIARRRTRSLPDAPGRDYTLKHLSARPNVTIIAVDDVHAIGTQSSIRTFNPHLGIALASPILRPEVFAIPKLGTLNLHKGKVPQYRGMPPAFWELWHDEHEVGCTVHHVEAKLDAGDVVCETTIERQRYSTVRGLQLSLDNAGIDLMRRAVRDTLVGTSTPVRQAPGGATFRKPTLAQIAELDRRLARAHPTLEPWAIRRVKDVALGGVLALSRTPLRRLADSRVSVLLYHRVTDDARDNLTVGIEQFNRQMELVTRYCELLTLEQLIALEYAPASERPLVCVTFDDGYLDNFTNAAPILERHGVPAAFFVSTGIIGSDLPFPHDVRRGNARPATMNWDHVRSLHERGFTIGSHSVTHIDCALESETTVTTELTKSMSDLRRRLGTSQICFAYPFGGREHMTSQRLELVRRVGYAACLSAYGGTNVGRIVRFNILRGGIHWGFSDRAFLVRCLGLS
jgi:peptidoglycan/xylan/chitin deacetylase (PgdA/CDA1 family)